MTKTVYVITHIDHPIDELLMSIIDPNEESKPTIYLSLAAAIEGLDAYKNLGMEYTIHTITLSVS